LGNGPTIPPSVPKSQRPDACHAGCLRCAFASRALSPISSRCPGQAQHERRVAQTPWTTSAPVLHRTAAQAQVIARTAGEPQCERGSTSCRWALVA
jgi:hypothetical protein